MAAGGNNGYNGYDGKAVKVAEYSQRLQDKSVKGKEYALFVTDKLKEKLGADYKYFGTISIDIQDKGLLIVVNGSYGEKERYNYDFATKELTKSFGTPTSEQMKALGESLNELMASQEAKAGGKRRSKKARKTKKAKRSKKSKTRRVGKKRA